MSKESRTKRKNDAIRWYAEGLGREYLQYDEDIVAAVEAEYGRTLTEHEQQIAIRAYTNRRNRILGGLV